jgi:hypothetical protein
LPSLIAKLRVRPSSLFVEQLRAVPRDGLERHAADHLEGGTCLKPGNVFIRRGGGLGQLDGPVRENAARLRDRRQLFAGSSTRFQFITYSARAIALSRTRSGPKCSATITSYFSSSSQSSPMGTFASASRRSRGRICVSAGLFRSVP